MQNEIANFNTFYISIKDMIPQPEEDDPNYKKSYAYKIRNKKTAD